MRMFLRGALGLYIVVSAGSSFGVTMDPVWLFADSKNIIYNAFRFCDTARKGDYFCRALESDQILDTGDSYDKSKYISFNYQFSSDSLIVRNEFDPTQIDYRDLRPGYAGFKTAWDYGLVGYNLARYKYLAFAHKGPNSNHRVTVRFWFNNGLCGAASYNEYIGTFVPSSTWKDDSIPIPESFQNRQDSSRNKMVYYEMVVLITNLDPNDTTSGPPGNLSIDNIRLVGCNPIDSSPKSQSLTEGDAATFRVATSRADSGDVLAFQWKKDGADIAGANNSVYTLGSVNAADAGEYAVAVTVSSSNLTFTSPAATLTVGAAADKGGCGCGAGTGTALIPPLIFKAMARRKRKKKNLKA